MSAPLRGRRPSFDEEVAAIFEVHSSIESRDEYRAELQSGRPLTRLERLSMGHTLHRKSERQFSRAEMRISEINQLLQHRHGRQIPENDDPSNGYVFAMACTINAYLDDVADRRSFMSTWLGLVASWIPEPDAFVEKLLRKMHPSRKHLTDGKIGRMLNLKMAERECLRIRTMSPADLTPLRFAKLRKEAKRKADRDRQERKRRARGAKPQNASIARAEPWTAAGCSKATWYRRKRRAKTNSSHACAAPVVAENETDSSPLIDSRKECDEPVSQLAGAPSVEPEIFGLESGETGSPDRPSQVNVALEPASKGPIVRQHIQADTGRSAAPMHKRA